MKQASIPYLITIFVLLGTLSADYPLMAEHLMGGEISYTCIGEDEYEFEVLIYRDCDSEGAPFDNPGYFQIYDANGTDFGPLQTPVLAQMEITETPVCGAETVVSYCIERARYEFTWAAPASVDFPVTVSYLRYSRHPSVMNIASPSETGAAYLTTIPELANCNNAAKFNSGPPRLVCSNTEFALDLSATDLDGDSLVYNLCTPLIGGNINCFQPGYSLSCEGEYFGPPYAEVAYEADYTAQNPIPSLEPISLDPQSGILTGIPTAIGRFVIAVCVSEYRDGELINTVTRDYDYTVSECTSAMNPFPSSIEAPTGSPYLIQPQLENVAEVQWSPADSFEDPSQLDQSLSEAGSYSLTVWTTDGCIFTFETDLSFYEAPPISNENLQTDINLKMQIYPVPAASVLHLSLESSQPGPAQVTLMDVSGRSVKRIQTELIVGSNQLSLSVYDMPAGLYFVELFQAGRVLPLSCLTKFRIVH